MFNYSPSKESMKTNILILCFAIASITAFAQSKPATQEQTADKVVTANIKVYGNCGMCKSRIEKALDYKGVKQSKWSTTTKMLEVTYVPTKIKEQKIHELIAAVGHDTDKAKAKDEVYAKLPFCCLYRDHDHSGMDDNKKKDH
jgi:periplasmic mercuric ion binding protein